MKGFAGIKRFFVKPKGLKLEISEEAMKKLRYIADTDGRSPEETARSLLEIAIAEKHKKLVIVVERQRAVDAAYASLDEYDDF